jgi:hypothetical protein
MALPKFKVGDTLIYERSFTNPETAVLVPKGKIIKIKSWFELECLSNPSCWKLLKR